MGSYYVSYCCLFIIVLRFFLCVVVFILMLSFLLVGCSNFLRFVLLVVLNS